MFPLFQWFWENSRASRKYFHVVIKQRESATTVSELANFWIPLPMTAANFSGPWYV